jgi:hypothetical protein
MAEIPTSGWKIVEHEEIMTHGASLRRCYHHRALGHFYVELSVDPDTSGRPFRLVEWPTGAVLYEGVTADTVERAMRTLEHMLAARTIRSTREVPHV